MSEINSFLFKEIMKQSIKNALKDENLIQNRIKNDSNVTINKGNLGSTDDSKKSDKSPETKEEKTENSERIISRLLKLLKSSSINTKKTSKKAKLLINKLSPEQKPTYEKFLKNAIKEVNLKKTTDKLDNFLNTPIHNNTDLMEKTAKLIANLPEEALQINYATKFQEKLQAEEEERESEIKALFENYENDNGDKNTIIKKLNHSIFMQPEELQKKHLERCEKLNNYNLTLNNNNSKITVAVHNDMIMDLANQFSNTFYRNEALGPTHFIDFIQQYQEVSKKKNKNELVYDNLDSMLEFEKNGLINDFANYIEKHTENDAEKSNEYSKTFFSELITNIAVEPVSNKAKTGSTHPAQLCSIQ